MAQTAPFALALLFSFGLQAGSPGSLKDLNSQGEEYPPFDYVLWRFYLQGETRKLAERRLADAPDTVDTLEILLEAQRFNDALAVLRRIVEKHPDRIPRAFEVVAFSGHLYQPEDGHGYNEKLQQILAIARKRLPELPREEAAWAAYYMLPRDTAPARTPGGWEKARRRFVEEYAGTQAASRGEPTTVQRRESSRQVVERKVLDPTALTYEAALRYRWHNNVDGFWDRESFGKARDLLVSASTEGQGLHRRKALAALASIYFYRHEYSDARKHYTKYLESYPRSAWAWVAALRVGECAERMCDWAGARGAYRTALTTYTDVPLVRMVGHAFMARAWEAQGRLDDARRALERALAAWDPDYDNAHLFQTSQRPDRNLRIKECTVKTFWHLGKSSITARIDQLERSARLPEGKLLERGRWLLAQNQRRDAWVVLEDLIAKHPQSPLIPDARYLAHRARVEEALELADVHGSKPNETAALRHLDRVARDPYDFGVSAAKIAKASILSKRGDAAGANALMGEALRQWHAHQAPLRARQQSTPLAREIADIRNLLFQPNGSGGLASHFWSESPSQPRRFVIVNPSMVVTHATGDVEPVLVYQPLSGVGDVLFIDYEKIGLLMRILDKLAGNNRTEAGAAIETLWNRFVQAKPGHDGGWLLYTFPVLDQIEFLDDRRSKALVPFRIGYEGATAVLEKTGGVWATKRLTNQWIQ